MSVKPILFNAEMVQAIQDGRKTVTRRLIKNIPSNTYQIEQIDENLWQADYGESYQGMVFDLYQELKPPYQPGDILYVRETFSPLYADKSSQEVVGYMYKVDTLEEYNKRHPDGKDYQWDGKWYPSIHMPKEAARIWLRVVDIRAERLQEITSEQVDAEGCKEYGYNAVTGELMPSTPTMFKIRWNATIKKSDLDRYGWKANPWVWVIEFERCEKPEEG